MNAIIWSLVGGGDNLLFWYFLFVATQARRNADFTFDISIFNEILDLIWLVNVEYAKTVYKDVTVWYQRDFNWNITTGL